MSKDRAYLNKTELRGAATRGAPRADDLPGLAGDVSDALRPL